jgi:lipoprotein-anchoring transpeptidase ErfK/SrfK
LFVSIRCAATRRWFVVVLLAVATLAAPTTGSAKPQKTIVVSISQQILWAYKGDRVMLNSYVSTGRAGFDTPVGSFTVLTKLPSQTMEGVIGGEYYNVPDVPSVLYFTNSGHALHGTYWHSNFGTPMSHGCVNLPLDVAAWLYDWAPIGTRVLIIP